MTRKHGAESSTPVNAWAALGLEPALLEAVKLAHYHEPTDIQRELIPPALLPRDCLGQARTGTGKTAAFTLPTLQRIAPGEGVQALILVPTRELALQVDEHVRMLAVGKPVRTISLLGGRALKEQLAGLKKGPEIAIGTPGRILDLMHRNALSLDRIRIVVLDEVDRMLDIGFRDDIRRILKAIPQPHQTLFVSATIDEEIRRLAKTYMNDPIEVNVSRDEITVDTVHQRFVTVHKEDKFSSLVGLLREENPTLAIVFTNMKSRARRIAQGLRQQGFACKEIHGDLVQERRERVMKSFRTQKINVLVATDLASRGLDVMEISHIINFDVPEDPAAYVHRIGRTARMGRTGHAITFVTPDEGKLLTEIEKLVNQELHRADPNWLVRTAPVPAPVTAPAAVADRRAPGDGAAPVPQRYTLPRYRDAVLDALGFRPVQRTLGSRFRAARRKGKLN